MYWVINVFVVHISMQIRKNINYFVKNVKRSIGLEENLLKQPLALFLLGQLSVVDFMITGRPPSIQHNRLPLCAPCRQ